VGAGFAGLSAAKALKRSDIDVILIDKSNHHLFQPLLYQVATAGLTPAEIASPIRAILRNQRNIDVRMDEVLGIDAGSKRVRLELGGSQDYDYLVLATGATHSYFGHDEWADYAPGLKTIDDAVRIRRDILYAFERADLGGGEGEWLTFVIIGGGPTGVELAGAIAELAKRTLTQDYDHIRPDAAKIILLEGADRLLGAFPKELGLRAEADLKAMGVEVRLNARVTNIEKHRVEAQGEWISSHCILWAAGVQAPGVGGWLNVTHDRSGRISVTDHLEVPELKDVFVVGDLAAHDPPLPGTAPVAMQQGRYVGKLIASRVRGQADGSAFRYFDKGNLATIGRSRAVGEIRGLKLVGFVAWAVWALVHIFYLIGYTNRFFVMIRWAWSYLTWTRGARLITGLSKPQPGEPVSRGR
jgi:NADH dehydrogenase